MISLQVKIKMNVLISMTTYAKLAFIYYYERSQHVSPSQPRKIKQCIK